MSFVADTARAPELGDSGRGGGQSFAVLLLGRALRLALGRVPLGARGGHRLTDGRFSAHLARVYGCRVCRRELGHRALMSERQFGALRFERGGVFALRLVQRAFKQRRGLVAPLSRTSLKSKCQIMIIKKGKRDERIKKY